MKKIIFLLLLPVLAFSQHTIKVTHKYYTLDFDTSLRSPLISSYIQTTAHATSSTKIDRSTVASFHQDPLIDEKYQVANDKEYRNNGHYDKGHLSPYTAFGFELEAAKESMLYPNTAPQFSFFNEHPWEELEQYVLKTLALKYDSIYVYTGCLYGNEKMVDVPVPDYYWKVIVYNGSIEAYLGKNEETKDTDWSKMKTDLPTLKKLIKSYYPKLKLYF